MYSSYPFFVHRKAPNLHNKEGQANVKERALAT